MSFVRKTFKNSKYQILPSKKKQIEEEKSEEIIAGEGFNFESISFFISNFVDPQDSSSQGVSSSSNGSQMRFSQRIETAKTNSLIEANNRRLSDKTKKRYSKGDQRKELTEIDPKKLDTLMKLKRKLENMKNFYPDVYYSDESIIELWARQDQLKEVNLDILNYDRDSPQWMWI